MFNNIKVSICIPTYNQPALFEHTLQSILVQDFKNYEIIITDDSQDDSIQSVIEKYLPNHQIKYFKNTIPKGSPANWNEAISRASGEYIKILHHDDWFTHKTSLSSFVKILDESPEINFCFSFSQVCNKNKKMIRTHSITSRLLKKLQKKPETLFLGNIIGGPSSMMYKRTNTILFDENMKWLVDIDFYIRILRNNKFKCIQEPLISTTAYAIHQVTYTCENNKEVELYEYLYLYNKISFVNDLELDYKLAEIFTKYNIQTSEDLNFLQDKIVISHKILNILNLKKNIFIKIFKKIRKKVINKTKKILTIPYDYFTFIRDFRRFRATNGERFSVEAKNIQLCLFDKNTTTTFDKHYIYHTAWAARKLKELLPQEHIDISSYTYFSTLLSAFIPIKFFDYRPAEIKLGNYTSEHADITALPFPDNSVLSLSCMHVVEHIGLGRYGDPIDVDGDLKAISELKRVISTNGHLLFVVPIGKAKIIFNAHRIYSYDQILSYFQEFELQEFTLIPDQSYETLIVNATKELSDKQHYACGCFWFKKK